MKSQWLRMFVKTSLYLFVMIFLAAQAVVISDVAGAKGDVDYLIVPGDDLENGELSGLVCARLQRAAEIYRNNRKVVIVVSGGKTKGEEQLRSELMREYLLETDVPDSNIICESRALELRQSILYSISYVTVDWYGSEEEIVLSPRIGLIMDNSFIYRYLDFEGTFGYYLYKIPVEYRWWKIPGSTLDQIIDLVGFHLKEAE